MRTLSPTQTQHVSGGFAVHIGMRKPLREVPMDASSTTLSDDDSLQFAQTLPRFHSDGQSAQTIGPADPQANLGSSQPSDMLTQASALASSMVSTFASLQAVVSPNHRRTRTAE